MVFHRREDAQGKPFLKRSIQPEQTLAAGFLLLILIGAALLSLPVATVSGESIGLGASLFTSTSAVCVTGLIVVDTGTTFSLFGQLVLLVLIQLGGLGFMIFATLAMIALGRHITLRDRMLIRESLNTTTLSGLLKLTRWYGLLALAIELLGAVLLATRFIPAFGWGKGVYFSLWHAVSAFCNAGFDLFGGFASLTGWQSDPVVLLTVSALIILGGLGFSVISETLHGRSWQGLSLHARLVLVMTGLLLVIGTVFFLLVERTNAATLGPMKPGEQLLNAFFQSVTMRTAGFNSIDLAAMTDASKLMSILLMFIGASPASTGGGVKTTTAAVLLLIVLSVIRGDDDVNVMGRRLPTALMRRALAILFMSMGLMLGCTMVLTLAEGGNAPLVDLLFESASAVATVGVSSVGTPSLSLPSKVVLIPMMFFGRVGPLTLAIALARRKDRRRNHVHYPEESITIG